MAFALAAVVEMVSGTGVHAQVPTLERTPLLAQASRTASFDIAAQPLAQALTVFGRQSGLQVAVNAASVAGKTSTAVNGMMSVEQALRLLLAGTGVPYRFTSDNAVTVSSAVEASGVMQLDPVNVQGAFPVPSQAMIDNAPPPYAGGQVATGGQLGLLGNRGVMDTPFNQTSYTAQKARDQQAVSVRDVLIDDPSIRLSTPSGSAGVDLMTMRGFSGGGAGTVAYGGLYGMLPAASIMAELAERIELLRGPSAMLNGMSPQGNIGGVINIVPKRAPDTPLTELTANYISAAQFGGHLDFGRRFGDDQQFGARLNAAYRAGQTEYQRNTDQRALGVLGLDFRGERVRLSADLGFQQQYIGGVLPYVGLGINVPVPWAPGNRTNTGQSWAEQGRKDWFGVVRAEVDLTERITAYIAAGAHDFRWTGLYSVNSTINTANTNGNATAAAPFTLNRYQMFKTAEIGLRAGADTGPIGHDLSIIATTFGSELGNGQVSGAAFATNIYNPILVSRPNIAVAAANKSSTQGLSSIAVADTLSAADKRIQLTVGGRLQQVDAANFNTTTGASTSSYSESAFSPSVAVLFKPLEKVSVYGNWIQGLQQGSIVPAGFTNAGAVFAPYKSTQYEAGIKVDWGKVTTTASVFQISQPSILTDVTTNTQVLGGEQRNRGIEFNVFGEPMEGVRVLGGAMFLEAVLTRTQGGTTDGWIAPFSPRFTLNLAGEWDVPFVRDLTLIGRVVYTASQYIDTTSPRRSLPDWTRFDIGARYAFENPGAKGKQLVARLNVENLFDTSFWEGGSGATTLFLGAPRTFRLSLTADF